MIQQCNLDSDKALQPAIAAILDRFAPDVATGDRVWATLRVVLRTWREEYGQRPVDELQHSLARGLNQAPVARSAPAAGVGPRLRGSG